MKKKKLPLLLIILPLLYFLYSLVYGRLAPLLPFMMGFETEDTGAAVIFFRQDTDISRLLKIDDLITETEKFHGMQFAKKAEVVVCDTDSEYKRYTGTTSRFVSYFNGRILISRRAWDEAMRGTINLEIYMKHELSHSLIHQHTGLLDLIVFPKWLLEGIAMASAGQMGTGIYPSKKEVSRSIKEGYFFHPDDFGTWLNPKREKIDDFTMDNKIAFFYSEYGCIMDDIIKRYGHRKFIAFVKKIVAAGKYKEIFSEVFGIAFEDYISNFKDDFSNMRPLP